MCMVNSAAITLNIHTQNLDTGSPLRQALEFAFHAYSTRIPHTAVLGRKNSAKIYSLILEIHNKKVPILRKNCRKTKKTEYPCGYSVVVRVLRFELKAS